MINALIDSFCRYYEHHQERTIIYIRDRYGDHRQANSSQSYNEQAIERLKSNGWYVIPHVHQGMEPPQHDKFLLIQNIFKEADPRFPGIRFNGVRCKFSIISMNNTRVTEHDGRFGKDKKAKAVAAEYFRKKQLTSAMLSTKLSGPNSTVHYASTTTLLYPSA